jgi:MSHA pilin protein MshD
MSTRRLSGVRVRGMTLIELVFAIVIISVGVAGVLQVYNNTVRNSGDPLANKQMLAIAEGMLEEVTLKPYAIVASTGSASGCNRSTFNDIWDYNNYATSSVICDVDGNTIAALAGYSMNVYVQADSSTFSAVGVSAAARITVTVRYGSRSLSLVSWRTNFAS